MVPHYFVGRDKGKNPSDANNAIWTEQKYLCYEPISYICIRSWLMLNLKLATRNSEVATKIKGELGLMTFYAQAIYSMLSSLNKDLRGAKS